MSKLLIVAKQEYARAVKSKAFLVGLFFMPVLMGGAFLVVGFTENMEDKDDKVFAVVDRSGALFAPIDEATR